MNSLMILNCVILLALGFSSLAQTTTTVEPTDYSNQNPNSCTHDNHSEGVNIRSKGAEHTSYSCISHNTDKRKGVGFNDPQTEARAAALAGGQSAPKGRAGEGTQ